MRWSDKRKDSIVKSFALKLIENSEKHGIDNKRFVAVNELDQKFNKIDSNAKLWPQTERLKAWCFILSDKNNSYLLKNEAKEKIDECIKTVIRYNHNKKKGLWNEVFQVDSMFQEGPTKASSLYHIILSVKTYLNTQGFINNNL